MIYLIRAGESGPFCKIGRAYNVLARLRNLQSAHYETLVVLRTWPGDLNEERALHQAFSEFHHRGEWFRFTEAMLDADPSSLLPVIREPLRRIPAPSQTLSLKSALKGAGLTQSDLARTLGVSEPVVSRWVRRTADVPTRHIALIASLLNVSAVAIIDSGLCIRAEDILPAAPASASAP